ncbi:hypothetical protein Q4I30_004954 [Leishmania utingensis]|uniref:Uncharacterized protein n=1 Tax=Leishmania utingensis TaxID=653362 RepID=A0AAW3AC35_9TRYP
MLEATHASPIGLQSLWFPKCSAFLGPASERNRGGGISALMQRDTRTGGGRKVVKDDVEALTVLLCCDDPTRRMHFTLDYIAERDLMTREALDQTPIDLACSSRVTEVDADLHHSMQGSKGSLDRTGVIQRDSLNGNYITCANSNNTSAWNSADEATGALPRRSAASSSIGVPSLRR